MNINCLDKVPDFVMLFAETLSSAFQERIVRSTFVGHAKVPFRVHEADAPRNPGHQILRRVCPAVLDVSCSMLVYRCLFTV